ncbi:MAG: hypothetical protein HY699_10565 [Deltaproteobacteria bacterium]|nr:hypothetical protein [Deltaproteobacteria bacterium]
MELVNFAIRARMRDTVGPGWLSIAVAIAALALALPAAANVATSTVEGAFFPNTPRICSFAVRAGSTPQIEHLEFGSLNFNPPVGLIPKAKANPSTAILTNVVTDADGNAINEAKAESGGFSAGIGPLANFFAVFTGKFIVDGSEQVTFDIYHDDGFLLGIGGGAVRIRGVPVLLPADSHDTLARGLPIVAAFNHSSVPRKSTVVVQFPNAGEYDFEFDYFTCLGTTRTLTVLANQKVLALDITVPTTPTPVPTTPSPGFTPQATGSPQGSPAASTMTPTRTVTPTPTQPLGVSLVVGSADADPGESVTLNIDFAPSSSDGKTHGPDEIAVLDVVLDFPKLDFDATDADGDGLPDAIVFNPYGIPALEPFAVTIFNSDTAAANHELDLEIVAADEDGRSLPAATLMAITLRIPQRSPGGSLLVQPYVRPFDAANTEHLVTAQVAGVVYAGPPPTRTVAPAGTIGIGVKTKGGGCNAQSGSRTSSWPFVPLTFLALLRYWRERRRLARR